MIKGFITSDGVTHLVPKSTPLTVESRAVHDPCVDVDVQISDRLVDRPAELDGGVKFTVYFDGPSKAKLEKLRRARDDGTVIPSGSKVLRDLVDDAYEALPRNKK